MWNRIFSDEVKWLYKIINKKKRYVGVLIFIQTLLSVCGVIYALLLRNVIDEATLQNTKGFFFYLAMIIGLVCFQIALRAVDRYLEEYLKSGVENACKDHLFQNLLKKDFESVNNVHSAEWMNRLTSDTVVCASGIVDILPKLIGLIVKLGCALAMILVLQPMFVWVLLPAGIVMLFFTYVFRKRLKKMHKEVQEKDGSLRVLLQEDISSLLVLKAFTAEEKSEQDAINKMKEHQQVRLRRTSFSNVCNTGFSLGMNALYLIGGVGYCGYGILAGTISYGTFTAMLQLISQIQSPFANLTGFMPKFYAMLASAERLMEVEKFENDCTETMKPLSEVQEVYHEAFEAIRFDKASFTYQSIKGEDKVSVALKDLSLEIKKKDYVALTGQSGCGKSTVLKLLMSLYTLDSGVCELVMKSGTETMTAAWRRLFAYVPQGNHLLSGTIRELVTFANSEGLHQDDKIKEALEIACAGEFVEELEDGIETLLGEKGKGLSEGQMQRLAIARAIFSDRPILLLDEATSALDEETEQKVLENLKNMTDKTVLIVTHRPKALEICNKVAHFTEQGVTIGGN